MEKDTITETVAIPDGVSITIKGMQLTIKAHNEETRAFSARGTTFKQEGNTIVVRARPANKRMYAIAKSLKSHITNMIYGAQFGYTAQMSVIFSHFPIKVEVKGSIVEIYNFVGEKKPRIAAIVGDTKVEVKGKELVLSGTSKEAVGQTCGNIEGATRLKERDRRIYQDGIFIVQKPQVTEAKT